MCNLGSCISFLLLGPCRCRQIGSIRCQMLTNRCLMLKFRSIILNKCTTHKYIRTLRHPVLRIKRSEKKMKRLFRWPGPELQYRMVRAQTPTKRNTCKCLTLENRDLCVAEQTTMHSYGHKSFWGFQPFVGILFSQVHAVHRLVLGQPLNLLGNGHIIFIMHFHLLFTIYC